MIEISLDSPHLRYSCLKTWCAVSVLTCSDPNQRIRMLNQWIQVAEALKGTIGNLFSFTAVMDGLGCKQVNILSLFFTRTPLCVSTV